MSEADEILAMPDVATETVDVPKWKRKVLIKEMTGTEREEWEQVAFGENATKEHFRAKLIVFTVHDPDTGSRLFTPEHIEALANKSGTILNQLFDAAAKLNGLRKSDEDAAIKNS